MRLGLFIKDLLFKILANDGVSILTKSLVVSSILAAFILKEYFDLTSFRAALSVGTLSSSIFLLLTSRKIRNYLHNNTLKGYWKYKVKPEEMGNSTLGQLPQLTRVVEVTEEDGEITVRGWILGYKESPISYFISKKVYFPNSSKKTGQLIYQYNSPEETPKDLLCGGMSSLEWSKGNISDKIKRLSGWYYGRLSNHIGTLEYVRISEQDFNELMKTSDEIRNINAGSTNS